jgi:hypothetical protein
MSTPFGAPIYSEAEEHTAEDVASQAQEVLDPNDPIFTSENIDVNPEVDAYAYPPPPPDGKYRAKIKLLQREDAQKQKVDWLPAKWGTNPPQFVLVTGVEASIIDPSGKYDGVRVFDRLVSTFVSKDHGTKVATILARLKRPDGSPWITVTQKPRTQGGWLALFKQALAGEPEIGIETQWEWSCAQCAKEAKAKGEKPARSIAGMQKFPQHRGVYQAEMSCPVNKAHGESRAQVRIARFLSEGELKK